MCTVFALYKASSLQAGTAMAFCDTVPLVTTTTTCVNIWHGNDHSRTTQPFALPSDITTCVTVVRNHLLCHFPRPPVSHPPTTIYVTTFQNHLSPLLTTTCDITFQPKPHGLPLVQSLPSALPTSPSLVQEPRPTGQRGVIGARQARVWHRAALAHLSRRGENFVAGELFPSQVFPSLGDKTTRRSGLIVFNLNSTSGRMLRVLQVATVGFFLACWFLFLGNRRHWSSAFLALDWKPIWLWSKSAVVSSRSGKPLFLADFPISFCFPQQLCHPPPRTTRNLSSDK